MIYRDVITLTPDSRSEGAELPDYSGTARIKGLPCAIKEIKGDETWRGRQLEARADYVIEFWHTPTLNEIPTTDRVTVTGGWLAGKQLNVAFNRFHDAKQRQPAMIELFCREVA